MATEVLFMSSVPLPEASSQLPTSDAAQSRDTTY